MHGDMQENIASLRDTVVQVRGYVEDFAPHKASFETPP